MYEFKKLKWVAVKDLLLDGQCRIRAGTIVDVVDGAPLVSHEGGSCGSVVIVRTAEGKQFAADSINFILATKLMWRYEGGSLINILSGIEKKAPRDFPRMLLGHVIVKKKENWTSVLEDRKTVPLATYFIMMAIS